MSEACCIISASTPRRPAVSTITTSYSARRAPSTPARATATGSPTPLPGSGAKTLTPARSPLTWSCPTAFGRWRSAATSSGLLPCSLSHSASFAASVVLPAPWRPASMRTVGGVFANRSRRVSPPRIVTSSSLTILMICCAGFSAPLTSSPRARSLTALTNSLTTGSATSASSSAIRISRAVASMSASESRPFPRRFLKVSASRSESVANNGGQSSCPRAGTERASIRHASDVKGNCAGECPAYGMHRSGRPIVGQHPRAVLLDVEHVDRLGTQRGHVRGAHRQVLRREGGEHQVHDAGAVVHAHLQHCCLGRSVVAHLHRRLERRTSAATQAFGRHDPPVEHRLESLAQDRPVEMLVVDVPYRDRELLLRPRPRGSHRGVQHRERTGQRRHQPDPVTRDDRHPGSVGERLDVYVDEARVGAQGSGHLDLAHLADLTGRPSCRYGAVSASGEPCPAGRAEH